MERKRIADAAKGVGKPKVGGPFELVDQKGGAFSDTDLKGKYALVRCFSYFLSGWEASLVSENRSCQGWIRLGLGRMRRRGLQVKKSEGVTKKAALLTRRNV